jgi:hypothetical protein
MTDFALGIVPTVTPMSGGSIASGAAADVSDNNDTTYIALGGGITSGLQYHAFAFDLGSAKTVEHVEVRTSDVFLVNDQFSDEAWRWWRVRVSDNGSSWTELATGLLNVPLPAWDNGVPNGPSAQRGGYTDPLPVASHRYWEYSFGKNHGLQGYGGLQINTIAFMGTEAAGGGARVFVI